MRKFLISAVVAGLTLVGAAPAMANHAGDATFPPAINNVHVKVDVCHWANGHPHIVPVSVNAVTTEQDAKHGSLTLTAEGSLGSFDAHDTPGHQEDFVARIYLKHGNTEKNLFVSENTCGVPPGPTTVTAFVCFEGEIAVFTDDDQTSLNLQVSAFLEISTGAVQVDSREAVCEVPEEPVVPVVPVTPETPVVPVVVPVTPDVPVTLSVPVTPVVPEAAPVAAPVAQLATLPRTGSNATLVMLGNALLLLGAAAYGIRRFATNQ